jgi:prophage antirepressor-like protein
MTTNNPMTVITSKPFGVLNVDVYQNDKHQYYMTREQIGAALEYNNPNKAIQNIHVKNTDRLDPLSTFLKLRKVEGGITKEREYIVYSLRGVMEICRLSRQPKADAFMDFCWDIMESLMRGDTVLATPQMDAALSKEFIDVRLHALFDSMKNLQSELDSTRKELSDQIEEARATSNEALNVISSVSQSVHQIKDKQMDNSIRAKSYTPRNVFRDEMSDWRKDLYSKIGVIANTKGYTNKETLHKIYEYLNRNYGFVLEDARAKYIKRTNRSGKISTIDIIEEDSTWKSIMEAVVADMYVASIERLHQNQNELRPTPKAVEAVSETNMNVTPVIDVVAKEVVNKKLKNKKQSETAKILFPIMMPLAEKLGDKPQYKHTYTLIYERIGYKKMNNLFVAYEKAHGKAPHPKTKVFIENEKNLALFKKTVKQLMKGQENK